MGPGLDLRKELIRFAGENDLHAAFVLTCVGSLSAAVLRMPGAKIVRRYDEPLEIISLVGTFSTESEHLHLGMSRLDGSCVGGHVEDGCIVRTTAEVVVGDLLDVTFDRALDAETGFPELVVNPRS